MPTRAQTGKKKKKGSTQAPYQYLGYSLQATRFIALLLQSDIDWKVSLECFEDVGAESADGNIIAEQVKSAKRSNPISDRAEGFWKTFSNWVDAINSRELLLNKTKFEIYSTDAKAGVIIRTFSEAKSLEQAIDALRAAKSELKDGISEKIAKYVNNVFKADDELVCKIIKNFNLVIGSESPHQELENLFKKRFVPSEVLKDVIVHSLGWVKKKTDMLIEQEKPAIISVQEFHSEIESFIRKLDRRTILSSFAGEPRQEEIEDDKLRTYVRQLELIDSNDDDKITAIIDYLKAVTDRTQWSIKGYVHESSFKEFEDGLKRAWYNYKKKVDISLKEKKEIERGQALYAECSIHRATLEGLETPNHFTPGSFHALADEKVLGWHPEYESLIADQK